MRPFRAAALRFIIWRQGKAVNWECTYGDLAQVTGIPVKTVRTICRQHGYRPKVTARGQHVREEQMPVDSFMRSYFADHRIAG